MSAECPQPTQTSNSAWILFSPKRRVMKVAECPQAPAGLDFKVILEGPRVIATSEKN